MVVALLRQRGSLWESARERFCKGARTATWKRLAALRTLCREAQNAAITMMSSALLRRSRLVATPIITPASTLSQHTTRLFSDKPEKRKTNVKKKKKGKQKEGGHDRNLDVVLRALDAPITQRPEPSEEEKARNYEIGRNYNIGMYERHNAMNHDLACKMKMKTFAIKMLPRNSRLKEEALKVDNSAPPLWRHIPTDTPPIPNFDPSKFIHHDED